MEKLQTLVWIALGLGVFIWRMVQKAAEASAREQRERPAKTSKTPPLPTSAFEEMLRQMQAGNPTPPVTRPAPSETTMGGRPLPREQAPPAHSLEHTQVPVHSLESARTARSLDVPDPKARLAATLPRAAAAPEQDNYWTRPAAVASEPVASRVRNMLQRPEDVQAAFVLSEILQRRF